MPDLDAATKKRMKKVLLGQATEISKTHQDIPLEDLGTIRKEIDKAISKEHVHRGLSIREKLYFEKNY